MSWSFLTTMLSAVIGIPIAHSLLHVTCVTCCCNLRHARSAFGLSRYIHQPSKLVRPSASLAKNQPSKIVRPSASLTAQNTISVTCCCNLRHARSAFGLSRHTPAEQARSSFGLSRRKTVVRPSVSLTALNTIRARSAVLSPSKKIHQKHVLLIARNTILEK